MIIQSRNILTESAQKTYLSNAEVAGTSVIRWKNPNAVSASWAVQIGETGEEQAEVVVLSSSAPSGTLGTLTSNTLYPHPADTPVYGIKFNQIVFERSTAGTAGTATPMTGGSITIQADSPYTIFDDTSGSSTYAYKTYFRNSVLAVNSTESDWITSGGFPFYALAGMRNRAKDKLWDANFVNDTQIDNWLNEWKDEMTNGLVAINENFALGTVNIGFGTDGLGTITTADFKDVRRVWVTYNGSDNFQSTKANPSDFSPDQVFSSAHPYHYFLGDNIIQVKPSDTTGTIQAVIYRLGTTMVNDTDTLPVAMRGYTKSFVDYGLAHAYYKDGKKEMGDTLMLVANNAKEQFKMELSPRDKTGPTNVRIVENINAFSGEWP